MGRNRTSVGVPFGLFACGQQFGHVGGQCPAFQPSFGTGTAQHDSDTRGSTPFNDYGAGDVRGARLTERLRRP